MAPKKKNRAGDASLKRSQGNPILTELTDVIAVLNENEQVAEAPKRPLCAYNYFFKYQRRVLMREGGAIGFGGLGKVVAERWKVISPEDLVVFEDLAARDFQRYKLQIKAFNRHKKNVAKGRRLEDSRAQDSEDAQRDVQEGVNMTPAATEGVRSGAALFLTEVQHNGNGNAALQGNASSTGFGLPVAPEAYVFYNAALLSGVQQNLQECIMKQFFLSQGNGGSNPAELQTRNATEGKAEALPKQEEDALSSMEPIVNWQVAPTVFSANEEVDMAAQISSDSSNSLNSQEGNAYAISEQISDDWAESLDLAYKAFEEDQ